MTELGKLTKVDLRKIWQTEARDFTPWLAQEENLQQLGEVIGFELELEAVEQNVGPFRADILCKNTLTDEWVLIENQLERTDHTHLGQLITYAAGLDAVTIVWIASNIADEHRAALDWLNEVTNQNIRFFGIEVELLKIGESPAAPRFNPVSLPNDWSRSTSAAKREMRHIPLTDTKRMQLDYWDAAEALLTGRHAFLKPLKAPAQSWIAHSIGKSGFLVSMVMNSKARWIRAEIYLGGKEAKVHFDKLFEKRRRIENTFGSELEWQRLDGKQDCRICISRTSDPNDRSDWPDQHRWLIESLIRLHDTFRPIIAELSPLLPGTRDNE
ncbi:DUF4268 domain-containing protein [Ruegeria sp. PrR005]|uniref:DUF4268 domain-containing protein n=1 Tax=Ruegeria sp. PrR005 TaxID=2706882 RepID=A0A6B2NI58_9RHOB|nr:DUF4268 domain-containing protein [Ruegeria sp. PrR005]NDW43781.1 DUF4268 domain-containing protein [Ruegeria sp. PrR005]